MKFRYTYLIWAGCLWLGVAGCASSGMSKKVAVTPVRTLTPDSMSTVGVDVNIHIPEKAFTGRTRLIVVPQLLQKDSMLAEYTPMVFDAPIYSKKMNRRVLLDGYVDTLAKVGFFRWLCMEIAKMVKYQVIPIFMTFMLLSFVLAMFIDSITVILFLAAVTIELSQLLEFDPVPMILSEIFCANLGGSATMCGDPPNIIIGTSLGYSFTDFITNTGLMAVVSLVFVVIYFYFAFRKELKKNGANKKDHASYPDPKEAITDKRGFIASCIIFLCAVVLLVSHAQTGLTVSTIGVAIAIVTLIVAGKDALELLKKVDYKTLLFFVGLFVVVSGLEETGVLEILAGFIGSVSGGNIAVMIAIIIIVSAVASAFIDNIPFAATMIPVITDLASDVAGVNLTVLAWALAIGTDIGGSATPIGASANVVGIATAAREGHIIKWGKYCKYMAPATIIVVAISLAMIYVRYL